MESQIDRIDRFDGDTIRVESRFKNARLYDAIARESLPKDYSPRTVALHQMGPIKAFCDLHHLNVQAVYALLNLQMSPFVKRGTPREICIKLSSLLFADFWYLFPMEIYEQQWPKRFVNYADASRTIRLTASVQSQLALPATQDGNIQSEQLNRNMLSVLKTLTPREELVIKKRFGLDNNDEMTLDDLGRELRVTRERVRQIEAKALRKLRHHSRSKLLRPFTEQFTKPATEEKKPVTSWKTQASAPPRMDQIRDSCLPSSSRPLYYRPPVPSGKCRCIIEIEMLPEEIRKASWSPSDAKNMPAGASDVDVWKVFISPSAASYTDKVKVRLVVFAVPSAQDLEKIRNSNGLVRVSMNA